MKPYVNPGGLNLIGGFMWEKPSYEIISAGAEVTAYIHKR
ncbi:MAG: pyrroloquinoline quinone precursor peptide PqqA [Candidatus Obscuribacterales bacterium]|nr:pyrroloquinoline quinone precursor peptide PqqA [Candidatus Obscuribacterales bacterium]